MTDINLEAEGTLKQLDCAVVYQHPRDFTSLPVVSYYNVTEHGALYTDNTEDIQSGYVQVDVWTAAAKECGDLTLRVNDIMTADGYMREMSADVPENDGKVYHKTMRFHKYFILKENEND